MHSQACFLWNRKKRGDQGPGLKYRKPSRGPGGNWKCHKGGQCGGGGLLSRPASEPKARVVALKSTAIPSPSRLPVSLRPAPSFLGQSFLDLHQGACGPAGDTVVTQGNCHRHRLSPAFHWRGPRLLLVWSPAEAAVGAEWGLCSPRMGRSEAHRASLGPLSPFAQKGVARWEDWEGLASRTFWSQL